MIITKLTNKTIYYLCADTHLRIKRIVIKIQLENGSILTIHQQISGTGGAKLDNLPSKLNGKRYISYSINKQDKQHGFSTFVLIQLIMKSKPILLKNNLN